MVISPTEEALQTSIAIIATIERNMRNNVSYIDKIIFFLYYFFIQTFFKEYTPEYEEELYRRIAEETKNKERLQKVLIAENKKKEKEEKQNRKTSASKEKEEEAKEAERQLQTEMRHQREEADTRALARAMMVDAQKNRPSLNNSCLNLLNSYQGKLLF